jgi:hypothetical protein
MPIQDQTFTIAEVAEKTGLSAHTLRYYERIGLLDVARHASGHRRFTERDITGVVFIGRLRATARSSATSPWWMAARRQKATGLPCFRTITEPSEADSASWRWRSARSIARSPATAGPELPKSEPM